MNTAISTAQTPLNAVCDAFAADCRTFVLVLAELLVVVLVFVSPERRERG